MPTGIYERVKPNLGEFKKGQVAHNLGVQKPHVVFKISLFLQGKPVPCKVHGYHLRWKMRNRNVQCMDCCLDSQKRSRKLNPIKHLLKDARSRKIGFDLDEDYIGKLLFLQGNRCALSGIEFGETVKPSLDRIDSSKGYTRGNVQLLCFEVNRMKTNLDEHRFIGLCKGFIALSVAGRRL